MKLKYFLPLLIALTLFGGCRAGHQQVLQTQESQVKLRSMQTRAFDTTDRRKALRSSIGTLQDLGFIIDKADYDLGSVSGSKMAGHVRITVSVRPKGEQMVVRANAQYGIEAVEDPETYQQFFASLSKAMFLDAHEVD